MSILKILKLYETRLYRKTLSGMRSEIRDNAINDDLHPTGQKFEYRCTDSIDAGASTVSPCFKDTAFPSESSNSPGTF